ncbi:hypothetical protein ACSHDV_001046 [Cronobacter sakazakii]
MTGDQHRPPQPNHSKYSRLAYRGLFFVLGHRQSITDEPSHPMPCWPFLTTPQPTAVGELNMAMEFLTKEFFIGAGSSVATALAGAMAFSRYWVSNRARNANDTQQIDMLDRQERGLDRLERENQELRKLLRERDEEIRKYFEELARSNARLEVIENQLFFVKQQNDRLTEEVKNLTESNQSLAAEVTLLRAALGAQK